MKKSVIKEILSTSIYLLCVLIVTYLIIHYVGQRTEVQGSSMEPTLQNADNLIVDKISYRVREPQRFDIIVFPFQIYGSGASVQRGRQREKQSGDGRTHSERLSPCRNRSS